MKRGLDRFMLPRGVSEVSCYHLGGVPDLSGKLAPGPLAHAAVLYGPGGCLGARCVACFGAQPSTYMMPGCSLSQADSHNHLIMQCVCIQTVPIHQGLMYPAL